MLATQCRKAVRYTSTQAHASLDKAYAREHPPAQPGNYVMMSVSDTGTGIDRSLLPRIFDPFFTTKEVGKGTGLGLSIVYGIVKQSGGYIWVYSEPGHGTTFKIYFPSTTAALDRPAVRSDNSSRPSGQLVLIVDDDPSIRDNIRDCLEQLGYRVLIAGSGDAALKICDDLAGKLDSGYHRSRHVGKELATSWRTIWPSAIRMCVFSSCPAIPKTARSGGKCFSTAARSCRSHSAWLNWLTRCMARWR